MRRDTHRTKFAPALAACAFALSAAFSGATVQAAGFNARDTSVQMFRWRWTDVANECTKWLGPQGYGAVQVSPAQASLNNSNWWNVYQPVNYTNLTSSMGTEAQFASMVSTCHAAGVRVYADVVVNQMAAGAGTATDGSTWNAATLTYPFFSGNDYHAPCDIQNSDYDNNRNNVMFCRLSGMPDMKTESAYVQGQIKNYLNKLLGLGVDGFRFDASKHIAPADLQAIVGGIASTTKAGESLWVTHEVIPDATVNRADYFSSGTINEFKFASALRAMFRNESGANLSQVQSIMGTPGNWGGTWGFVDTSHATVFVNNWDTERNGGSLNASNYVSGSTNDTQGTKRYDLANIFMLAWPYGHAQVHSGFRFSGFDQGPPASSPYDASGNARINVEWDFIHRWSDVSNMVALRAAASGQDVNNFVSGTGNQIAFNRGSAAFVALNNDAAAWNATFQTLLPPGTYCNVVNGKLTADKSACTGDSVTISSNGRATLSIPGNGGASVPAVALHIKQVTGATAACTSVPVKFRVANANTVSGQSVYVNGNRSELGTWTPTAANLLTIEGSGANAAWSRTINLPPSTPIQFKFMKHGGVADVWESNQTTASGNREAVSQACGASTLVLDVGNFKF